MMLLAMALLFQQPRSKSLPVIERPGAGPDAAATLRALCPGGDPADARVLLATEQREAGAAAAANTPDAWLALGCTRALLSLGRASSHDGPLMLSGDSWAQGAITTVLKVLAMRPGDRRAADILAVYAMDESDPKALAKVVTRLDDAVRAGASGGPTLRACAELGLRVGRPDVTRRCASAALRAGNDSTADLLLDARLDAAAHDTVGTSATFLAAVGAAHDTLSELALAWQLQWFLTPDEVAEWDTLPASRRVAWVRDQLASRDVRDGQPAGARLVAHFERLAYVDSAFRLKVARVMHNTMLRGASAANIGTDPTYPDTWRDYSRWQLDFDDRGAVWMRFGAPLKRFFGSESTASSQGRGAAGRQRNGNQGGLPSSSRPSNAFETWLYQIDGKPLLLTFAYEPFSGEAGASRLVSGNIGDIYCGLDTWRCLLSMRQSARGQGVTPELRQQVREQDGEFIRAATTKDDNSVRTDKAIELIARMNRLWDPATGAPIALVTWAVKPGDLVVQTDHDVRTTRVEFDLRSWDGSAQRWQDTAFTRRFNFNRSDVRHLTGFIVAPASADVSSWSLVATQGAERRGRAWDVTAGPLDAGPVAISDLVLGQSGQGLTWAERGTDVLLAPLNAVSRTLPVSLYYQIRSNRVRPGLRTTIALYRVDGGVARDSASLQVGFAQDDRQGINEVAQTIDVSRLDKGTYRLEVRLTDAAGTLITRRGVELMLE